VLLPFIKAAFDRGDKAFHVVDPAARDDHLRRLQAAGIDLVLAHATGQFELQDWNEAYLRGGAFDPDRMLATMQRVLTTGREQGFAHTHIIGPGTWGTVARPGVQHQDDLLEYEARLNEVVAGPGDLIICLYDLTKFDPGAVLDIVRTHPIVVVGGVVQENALYVQPDAFLPALQARRAVRQAMASPREGR
jgi:hypothetical protein